MTETADERIRTLRHDLSNPLAAILAETQLMLLSEEALDPQMVESLRDIESAARRMREILQAE